jgi:hypothetical protein
VFLRSRERPAEVWQRFVLPSEGFELLDRPGLFAARVVANADRAVVVFSALASHLDARVRVALDDRRGDRRWSGAAVDRDLLREVVLRAGVELSVAAGTEVAAWDDGAQITLSDHLDVVVYARSERWYYVLRGLGLTRHDAIAPRSWRIDRGAFPAAPSLALVVREIAQSLALTGEAP